MRLRMGVDPTHTTSYNLGIGGDPTALKQMTRPAFDSFAFSLEVDDWSNDELIARFHRLYSSLDHEGVRAFQDEIEKRLGWDAMNAAAFTA